MKTSDSYDDKNSVFEVGNDFKNKYKARNIKMYNKSL